MNLLEFRDKVERAWNEHTSYNNYDENDWFHDPAFGQCAVTACLVTEYFGFKIKRGVVKDFGTHYWNYYDGIDIDLTWRQFPAGSTLSDTSVVGYYHLAEGIKPRLDILRQRFEDLCINQ